MRGCLSPKPHTNYHPTSEFSIVDHAEQTSIEIFKKRGIETFFLSFQTKLKLVEGDRRLGGPQINPRRFSRCTLPSY